MVEAKTAFAEVRRLLAEAGVEEAAFEAELLFQHLTKRHHLLAGPIDETQYEKLLTLAQRRQKREPLQYILGSWDFLGLSLEVGPGVLIPRPETEDVCLAAAQCLRERQLLCPTILDLCAGSGVLALGLQQLFPAAYIAAAEKYEGAFTYLVRNCANFAKSHPAAPTPVQTDVLQYHRQLAPCSVDLIVSNPPYVSETEYLALAPELGYEPKEALVASEKGLFFYCQIAKHYHHCLKPTGLLVLEIGALQGDAVLEILRSEGYAACRILPDGQNLPRVAVACRQ